MKVSGVIWIGRFFEHGGWGTIARNYVRGLHKIGFPVKAIPVGTIHPDLEYQLRSEFSGLLRTDVGTHPVVVIDKGTSFHKQVMTENIVRRIGCTLAETDRVPLSTVNECEDIDELWVPSHFAKETFSRCGLSENKIRVVPYSIDTDAFPARPQKKSAPGNKNFVFLFMFGIGYRKGYDLLLEAYLREFKSKDNTTLVMKTFSGDFHGIQKVDAKSKVLDSMADRIDLKRADLPHVAFVDDILSHEQLVELYSSCDLYISTVRAEGWGFPCMEAMAMGVPASAINWSGNTEYMNKNNSLLIEPTGRLVPVDPRLAAAKPQYENCRWAEVRVEEVQRVMRFAYQNQGQLKQIAEYGMKDIRENYSLEAVAEKIVDALSKIQIDANVRIGRPKVRFAKFYRFKFRLRLLYYRLKNWYSSFKTKKSKRAG